MSLVSCFWRPMHLEDIERHKTGSLSRETSFSKGGNRSQQKITMQYNKFHKSDV
jgi:hypothetical protein